MNEQTTILMADDDEGHVLLIIRALRKAGLKHQIVRFSDGQKLLEFLNGEGVSVGKKPLARYILLLDIRMPKVDGVEALQQIKNSQDLRNMPVIMLTTADNPDEIEKCYQLGCNSYMVKPVKHTDFSDSIQSLGKFLQKSEIPPFKGRFAS